MFTRKTCLIIQLYAGLQVEIEVELQIPHEIVIIQYSIL